MKIEEIMEQLILALEMFYSKDCFLIKEKVHERSMTHKLAEGCNETFMLHQ